MGKCKKTLLTATHDQMRLQPLAYKDVGRKEKGYSAVLNLDIMYWSKAQDMMYLLSSCHLCVSRCPLILLGLLIAVTSKGQSTIIQPFPKKTHKRGLGGISDYSDILSSSRNSVAPSYRIVMFWSCFTAFL